MKIAMVTPWPQERSGIADYSYDLARGLTKLGSNIHIFTTCDSPKRLNNVQITNGDPSHWRLFDFDIRVFHFGNNLEFHRHMMELLKEYGGVVHLHDFVLHHMIAGLAQFSKGWEWYFNLVSHYYGCAFSEQVKGDWECGVYFWEENEVLKAPLNDEVVEIADAIITHSHFAKSRIQTKHRFKPVAYIEQVYDMKDVDQIKHDKFVLGVFGHVQPNKCIDQLLDALALVEPGNQLFEVRVAGKIADDDYYKVLCQKHEKIKAYVALTVLDYLDDDDFLTEMNSVDMVIALRNPTMGETSAIAMRSLQLNKPLVVTDTGWYSELPDFVYKVDTGLKGTSKLADIIQVFTSSPDLLPHLQQESEAYANERLSFLKVCQRYLDTLHDIMHMNTGGNVKAKTGELLASHLYQLGLVEEVKHKHHRTFIYEKLIPFLGTKN